MAPSSHRLHWWQRGVVYQIYPRSFKDSNHDGIGDLQGVVQKMDYFNLLGIDAIWFSPIFPSPMVDFGYDVSDYCDIDPMFGDLTIFDKLVAEAHLHGLKVIIDWVPNHTSDQHPWFIESRSSKNSPKRDWYIWREPKADGGLPNNWGSFFGGPAWTYDASTGQYYMHQFCKEQPELNWRNPAVRVAMLDTLRFWLKRGVDGFRMDVVGLLIKDKDLRDNPPNPNAAPNLLSNDIYGRQLQVYNLDQDEVHEIIRDIRSVMDEYPDRCGIGELWGPLPRWVKYYGEHGEELQLPFNFRLMDVPWRASAMRKSVDEMEATLPPFAWPNYVLGNHDRIRLASRFSGQAQARLAAMMLLSLRGTPTVYYGDELGLENGIIPLGKIQDPQGVNLGPERTRDVARTPMQWDAGPNAGFSTVEPWLPVSADFVTRNVAAQLQDPTSILNLYRKLFALRRSSPALYGGSYHAVDVSGLDCFAFMRQEGDEKRLVVLNFSSNKLNVDIEAGTGHILLSTHMDRQEKTSLHKLMLRAYEGVIIEV
jgi:alpha-glucosidase